MQRVETRPRRVLVVEDDAFLLELITTRLELAGFDTRSARDGSQALQRLTEFRPEAMVLDINMPARNSPEDVAKAIKLGARDYLSKPFRDEQLIARVGRLLVRSRATAARP